MRNIERQKLRRRKKLAIEILQNRNAAPAKTLTAAAFQIMFVPKDRPKPDLTLKKGDAINLLTLPSYRNPKETSEAIRQIMAMPEDDLPQTAIQDAFNKNILSTAQKSQ